MAARRRIPGPVLDHIRFTAIEHPDWNPSQVFQSLTEEDRQDVSYRTVQRVVASFRPAEPGILWDFWTADPDDAALLMPIQRELLERRPWGQAQLTGDQAADAAQIRRAFPDFTDLRAVFTLAFLASRTREDLRGHVEEWLVFTPWRDGGAALTAAVEAGSISPTTLVFERTIKSMWKADSDG